MMGDGVWGWSWGRGGGRLVWDGGRGAGLEEEGQEEMAGEGVMGWRGEEGGGIEGGLEEVDTAGEGVAGGGREEEDEKEREEEGRGCPRVDESCACREEE